MDLYKLFRAEIADELAASEAALIAAKEALAGAESIRAERRVAQQTLQQDLAGLSKDGTLAVALQRRVLRTRDTMQAAEAAFLAARNDVANIGHTIADLQTARLQLDTVDPPAPGGEA